MKRITSYLESLFSQYRSLFRNFTYLSFAQVFNMLLSLATYPYLIRVLGNENFGLIAFSQAVVGYLVILISFGFNLTATREISVNRDDPNKINEIVSSVLSVKLFLLIISLLILCVFLLLLKKAEGYETLFLLTMWMCVYELLFPSWYFQGVEKMQYITLITLITRTLFLILIFVMVHNPDDYLMVPAAYFIGIIPSGIIVWFLFKKQKIKFLWPGWYSIKRITKLSVPVFISNLSGSLYLNTSKVLLGLFTGMSDVAIFELADKLALMIKMPAQLFVQSIFPQVANDKKLSFVRNTFYFTLAGSLLILTISMIWSDSLVNLIGGNSMSEAVPVFRVLGLSIIPAVFTFFYANITLISWGYNTDFLKQVLYVNLIYLIIVIILLIFGRISLMNLAITALILELAAALISVSQCSAKKLNFLIPKSL